MIKQPQIIIGDQSNQINETNNNVDPLFFWRHQKANLKYYAANGVGSPCYCVYAVCIWITRLRGETLAKFHKAQTLQAQKNIVNRW